MDRLNGRRTPGGANPIRRPLIWSLTSHLLAVSSLFLLGGGAASVPFRGVVDVLLVGAAEGKRAASMGTVRAAPGVPKKETGRDISPPPGEEAGRGAELPKPPGGSAGETAGREVGGAAGPSPAEGGKSNPDTPQFPQESAASAGVNPPMSGGMGRMAGPGSEAEGVAAGPAGMPIRSPDPGRLGEGNGAVGGTSVLRERIQSRIVYPDEAIRRGQEGDVLLRIRIGAGGVPGEIRIARSSGVRLLDAAARKGVVRAAPLPGSAGWVEVPVRFRLR